MITRCAVCGEKNKFVEAQVLWPELVQAWRLSPDEARDANRQQGLRCDACGCNLRSVSLAAAIMRCAGLDGDVHTFDRFVASPGAAQLAVLEVNGAGDLSRWLERLPGHTRVDYPEVKMERLPFDEASFHLVVHSDTLEHVEAPVLGLTECRRVLKVGGHCAFTVPLVVGRMTSRRDGLPPSYHSKEPDEAMRVVTEYGADAWKQILQAGFAEARVVALERLGLALVGVR